MRVYLLYVNGILADIYAEEADARSAMAGMLKEHGTKYDCYIVRREVKE